MATKNIVPNADSEGGIGTSSKYWATGFIDAITTTGNLVIGGSIDLEGSIDVNGTTNLDIVDIDGAVNIATTALVTGVLTTTATQVANGGITSGSDIISDTDSTDSLGSTGVRWLKGWFDTLAAGTLTIGSGSITDSSGAISFGNENLTTTGISKSSQYLIGRTTSAGIGASLGDINGAEVGAGYLSLSRDDTADAKQIVFEKNDSEHSYLQTTSVGLNIYSAKVGIDTGTPDSKLHVHDGSAGTVSAFAGTLLTLETSGNNNFLSFLSPAAKNQGILFGDAGANYRGQLQYNHDGDNMLFYTAAAPHVKIDNTGLVQFQAGLDTSASRGVFLVNQRSSNNNNYLQFRKSRGVGSGVDLDDGGAITAGDWLGQIDGTGAYATDSFSTSSRIIFKSTGTVNSTNEVPGVISFNTKPNSSASLREVMYLDADANVNVNVGNLIIGTAGKGITFSSTNTPAQNAGSGTHNTLDDYEEGTWTPTVGRTSGTQPSVSTYGYQKGTYTKAGRLVVVMWDFTATVTDQGSTAAISIKGLPFPVGTDSAGGGGMAGYSVVHFRASSLYANTTAQRILGGFAQQGDYYMYVESQKMGTDGFASGGSVDNYLLNTGSARSTGTCTYFTN